MKIEIAYKRENEQDFFNFEVDSGESGVCYKTNSQWDVWSDAIPTVKIDGREISFARLRELAEAERDGRVVVLPCKVGQTFYGVNRDSGHIYEQVFDYAEVCLMEKSRDRKRGNRGYIVLDNGKKTKIYLDRKAAERALSGSGEGAE